MRFETKIKKNFGTENDRNNKYETWNSSMEYSDNVSWERRIHLQRPSQRHVM